MAATASDLYLAIKKIRTEAPQLAYLLDDPEVGPLLVKWGAGQIDDVIFESKLHQTEWWRTTSESERQWAARVAVDPATANRQRQQMAVTVRQIQGQLGVDLPQNWRKILWSHGQTAQARIADMALSRGWNEDQITRFLMSFATFGQEGQEPQGGIGLAMGQIDRLRAAYMIPGANQRESWKLARKMLTGELDADALEEQFRRQAKARFANNDDIVRVLDEGGSLADYFEPYRQTIAQELDMLPEQIDLLGRRWRQVVDHAVTTPQGGETGQRRSMTLDEVTKLARSQSEWSVTRGGQQHEAEMTKNLLNVFGKVAS